MTKSADKKFFLVRKGFCLGLSFQEHMKRVWKKNAASMKRLAEND